MVINIPFVNQCIKSVWVFQKHEKADKIGTKWWVSAQSLNIKKLSWNTMSNDFTERQGNFTDYDFH